MPTGFPTAPAVQTITDKLATIAPELGNVPGYYVYLKDPIAGTIYESATATDGSGNWSISGVTMGLTYQYSYGRHPATAYPFQGAYVASNPPTGTAGSDTRLGRAPTGIVGLGDSITILNTTFSGPAHGGSMPYLGAGFGTDTNNMYQVGSGYLQMGCALLGQRLRFMGAFGRIGDTSTVIAEALPLVLAMNPLPGYCVVQTNWHDTTMTLTQSQANHAQIASKLKAAGIQPIMATMTPQNGLAAGAKLFEEQMVAWVRRFAEANGLPLLDFHARLTDPTTGGLRANYNLDNTHQVGAGYWAMAQEFLSLPVPPYSVYLPHETSTDTLNMLLNGNFLGAGPAATSWGVGVAGNGTPSVVSGDPGINGQWQQIAMSGAGALSSVTQVVNKGTLWADLDILAFSCVVQSSGTGPGVMMPIIDITTSGGNHFVPCGGRNNNTTELTSGWACDMDRATVYLEFEVPAGQTTLTVQLEAIGGQGKVRFGQCALINLTKAGLLNQQNVASGNVTVI